MGERSVDLPVSPGATVQELVDVHGHRKLETRESLELLDLDEENLARPEVGTKKQMQNLED